MSTQEALVPVITNLTIDETDKFREYLRTHLTDATVMDVLEQALLEENSTYNPISFEQALKEIQQKDGGRYLMLKTLLEGYATKEGLVMLDPKLVSASYKERMRELDKLKAMSRWRRLVFRLGQAVVSWWSEKNETEVIQESIQITGELQLARTELRAIELKRNALQIELDEAEVKASNERRQMLMEAGHKASEIIHEATMKTFDEFSKGHEQWRERNKDIDRLSEQADKKRNRIEELSNDIAILEEKKRQLLTGDPKVAAYYSKLKPKYGYETETGRRL